METNEGGTMIAVDLNTRAGRMLNAGRVTVTFSSPTGQHITLTAKARGTDENDKWTAKPLADAKVIFIEVPNSQGWNDKVGKVTRSRGFVADPNADKARAWCAGQLLKFVAGQPLATGLEAREESNCGRCGRTLTDPVSIDRGIGPECYGQITGSQHETKTRETAADRAAATEPAPSPEVQEQVAAEYGRNPVNDTPAQRDALDHAAEARYNAEYQAVEIALDQAAVEENEAAQVASAKVATDKQGVPLAVGGWKARRSFLQKELKAERKTAKATKPTSQNRIQATGDAIPY